MDVFISYARGTAASHALALQDALTADGVAVFLDTEEIPYGSPFPERLAAAIAASRVAVVFLDESYVTRPWCVLELQMLTSAYRGATAPTEDATEHIIVALPDDGATPELIAYLPPPLAARSWPVASATAELATLVAEAAGEPTPTLADRLEDVVDDAAERLRSGGQVPVPWPPQPVEAPDH